MTLIRRTTIGKYDFNGCQMQKLNATFAFHCLNETLKDFEASCAIDVCKKTLQKLKHSWKPKYEALNW